LRLEEAHVDKKERKSLPYVPGSETSKAAAERNIEKAGPDRQAIYEYLVGLLPGGSNDYETEQRFGLHQTISARRRDLVIEGRCKASGETRPTGTGSQATVWVAVTDPEEQAHLRRLEKPNAMIGSIKTNLKHLTSGQIARVLGFVIQCKKENQS